MKTSLALGLLLTLVSCGKIQQVQDSFALFGSNSDIRLTEVRIGAFYRNDPAVNPSGYNYLIFENTQYRLGTLNPDLTTVVAALPKSQEIPVYFKGSFAARSGIVTSNPTQSFDVVDLTALTRK